MTERRVGSVTLDEQLHLKLWKLQFRRSVWNCLKGGLIGIVIILLVIALTDGLRASDVLAVALIGSVALTAVLVVGWLTLPRRARQVFRESAGLHEQHRYELDETGFTTTQTSGHLRANWSDLVKWDETDEIFVIFPNRLMGYLIPKGQVSPEFVDYARLRLIDSGLSIKGKLRK